MIDEDAQALARARLGFLPADVVAELRRAGRTGPPGSRVRQLAIDHAYTRSEARYPFLFNRRKIP